MTIPINYYDTLDSFIAAREKAKSFNVIVETKSGEAIRSSALPIAFLAAMIAALETADASGTSFPVWDRKNNSLVQVPHNNIKFVSISLVVE